MTLAVITADLAAAIPCEDLQDKHVEGCRILPNRLDLLDRLGTGGRVAEVGCAFGDFSALILERCEPDVLHLIDTWDDRRYARGEATIRNRFARWIHAGRILLHRGRSVDQMARLPDASLDWVYLDTDHSFTLTRRELRVAAGKVRPGGRICGHDFCLGNPVKGLGYGVIRACHQFCVTEDWGYEFLTLETGGHFSFCLKRLRAFQQVAPSAAAP